MTVALIGVRINAADVTTNWGNDGGGGGVSAEPDVFYQGVASMSRKVSASRIGRDYTHGTGTDLGDLDNTHYMCKIAATNYAASEIRTTPALGIKIGSASTAYQEYYLFGSDNYPPAGGFQFVPISARVAGYRTGVGALTGAPDYSSVLYWSVLGDFTTTAKAENVIIDALDLSVGLALTGADSTFQSLVTADEGTVGNRWGHVITKEGVIYVQGKLLVGRTEAGTVTSTQFSETTGGTMVWQNGLAETGFHVLEFDLGDAATTVALSGGWKFSSQGIKGNDGERAFVSEEDTRTQLLVVGTTAAIQTITAEFQNFSKATLTSKVLLDGASLEAEIIVPDGAEIQNSVIRTLGEANRATIVDPVFATSTDIHDTEFVQAGTGHAISLDDGLGSETASARQAAGTSQTATTTTTTPPWPAHAADDIGLLTVETDVTDIPYLSTPAGFEFVTTVELWGGASNVNGTRLTVWWKRASSASETNPIVAACQDHQISKINTIRGCATVGLPWSEYVTATATGATTRPLPGVTTKVDGQFVFGILARGTDSGTAVFSNPVHAGLTSVTDEGEMNSAIGNGGGMQFWSGIDTVAGATGDGTIDVTLAGPDPTVAVTFAMRGINDGQGLGGFQVAQTVQSGIGAVAVAWPTHLTDDVAFLILESDANDAETTLSTPAGFTLVEPSSATTTGGADTRLTIWWHRATSAAMATPTIGDAGDHIVATMVTYRGLRTTGNPWDAIGTTSVDNVSDTSSTFPSVTTLHDGQLVMGVMAQGFDGAGAWGSAHVNASLASITERFDDGAIDNSGGGLNVFDAYATTAGATGTTAVTLANASRTVASMFSLVPIETTRTFTGITWTGWTTPSTPLYRNHAITNQAASTSVVATAPTLVEGDLLLCMMHRTNGVGNPGTLPTGWVAIEPGQGIGGPSVLHIYYKIATASEPGTYTWSGWSDARATRAVVASYPGVDPTIVPHFETETTAVTIASDFKNALSVSLAHQLDLSTTRTCTSDGSATERFDSRANSVNMALYDEPIPGGGNTRTTTLSPSISHEHTRVVLSGGTGAIWIPDQGGKYIISISGGDTPTAETAGALVQFVASTDLTLTGLVNPTEVRVYESGTQNEIDGTENVTTGTVTYSIDSAAFSSIDIRIITKTFDNQFLEVVDMTSGNVTIPIVQILSRVFSNP